MSDFIKLQSRCQRGEASLAGANNLLAECHAALGKLIADNDRLNGLLGEWDRSSLGLALIENTQLKAENDALRKDADRYRWTSIEGNWVARMCGKWRAHIGEYGDASPTDWYATREEAIDAAMVNGEQS